MKGLKRAEGFEDKVRVLVNDLIFAYDKDSEDAYRKILKEDKGINNIAHALDKVIEDNDVILHEITAVILGDKECGVLCKESAYKDKGLPVGGDFSDCQNCPEYDDCYDNVYQNDVYWEFSERIFPINMCYLLYSILSEGEICMYMTNSDFYEYSDLAQHFEYGNEAILQSYYENGGECMTIINHSQMAMFDDLDSECNGSSYMYGRFILMNDSFESKNRENYYVTGGH